MTIKKNNIIFAIYGILLSLIVSFLSLQNFPLTSNILNTIKLGFGICLLILVIMTISLAIWAIHEFYT